MRISVQPYEVTTHYFSLWLLLHLNFRIFDNLVSIFFSFHNLNPHTGDQMVFFLLNVVEFLGLVLTFRPFMAMPEQQYDRN